MIKIMADSTCDLSREIIDQYDIGIAPLTITIDNKVYRDRLDISPDEFYRMQPHLAVPPTTAMPNPSEYIRLFEKSIDEGHKEILCICMSSGTSGAYSSAVMAMQQFYKENPDATTPIYVVDSLSMSHGSGWLILKSARLREQGAGFTELIEFNENYKLKVKHFLSVDDLNHLLRSGRLSNAGAYLGRLLNLKPIMSMKDGRGAIVAKQRGRRRVLDYYVHEFKWRMDREVTDFIIIGYTSDIEPACDLQTKIKRETDYSGETFIMQMGVAVGTHVGPGGLSMFFAEKNAKKTTWLKQELNDLTGRFHKS